MTPTEVRLALLNGDYDPIPLRGKNPGLMERWGWQKIGHASPEQATNWLRDFPDATNTGALTLRMPTLDIDIQDSDAAEAVEHLILDRYGEHGQVLTRIGKAPKRAIPFRTDAPFAKITHKVLRPDGVEERFEFLSEGQQVVVDGIHPDTRQPYRWEHGDLFTVPRSELPLIRGAEAQALANDAVELIVAEHGYRAKGRTQGGGVGAGDVRPAADWVSYFNNLIDHDNNAALVMALLRSGMHGPHVHNLVSAKIAALVYPGPDEPASRQEWEERRARRVCELRSMIESAARKLVGDDNAAPLFSEEALALKFVARYGEDFRYIAEQGWVAWHELRWRNDTTTRAWNLARVVCRNEGQKATEPRLQRMLASNKSVHAVVGLAKVDQRIVMEPDRFDAGRGIINAGGLIVDLETGAERPATREDYCLMMTAVRPTPIDTPCPPIWWDFLVTVTANNEELIGFLQRWLGYCLTGYVIEHALAFLYGGGGNGKTVFIDTVTAILGDYALTAPMDMFLKTHHDRHPTELARLNRRRLVLANETTKGHHWDEAKIKNLTGGDKISARFMRQDFFEFAPTHKLMLAGNSKPGLASVDDATRRRFLLVPFTVKITKPDKQLGDKLVPERPAILRWMIDGARWWHRSGLAVPECVRTPTEEYLADQDSLSQWIEERTHECAGMFVPTKDLFGDWRDWCGKLNLLAGTEKAFTEALKERGWVKDRKNSVRGFKGHALLDPGASGDQS
jgi:P4 family phage/plasmid primase-like protien